METTIQIFQDASLSQLQKGGSTDVEDAGGLAVLPRSSETRIPAIHARPHSPACEKKNQALPIVNTILTFVKRLLSGHAAGCAVVETRASEPYFVVPSDGRAQATGKRQQHRNWSTTHGSARGAIGQGAPGVAAKGLPVEILSKESARMAPGCTTPLLDGSLNDSLVE